MNFAKNFQNNVFRETLRVATSGMKDIKDGIC